MTQAEATKIVIQLAETKWISKILWWKKLTKEQEQALRKVSAMVEYCTFPDGSTNYIHRPPKEPCFCWMHPLAYCPRHEDMRK